MNGIICTVYSFTKCSKFKQKSGSGAISVWGRNDKDSQHNSALGCTAFQSVWVSKLMWTSEYSTFFFWSLRRIHLKLTKVKAQWQCWFVWENTAKPDRIHSHALPRILKQTASTHNNNSHINIDLNLLGIKTAALCREKRKNLLRDASETNH